MIRIHDSADVSPRAILGEGTQIWHQAQIREEVTLGCECIVGKGAYIDHGVQVGNRVKIQNYACLYHGARLEDGVFVGPHACITNDTYPRAVTPEGDLKGVADWQVGPVLIKEGASLGAMSVVLPGVTVGRFAMVGSCSVVTSNVPDHGLVMGNPARLKGFVCCCGWRLAVRGEAGEGILMACQACGREVVIPQAAFGLLQPR